MKPDSVIVRYRTVAITVFPWSPRPGVEYWKFRHGKKHIVRSTLDKAKAEAKRIAEETYIGAARLGMLSDSQTQAIRRMLAVDPQLALVDDFLLWHSKAKPKKSCKEAVAEFIDAKTRNAGNSALNVTTLSKHLAVLPEGMLCDITPAMLPALTGAPRTRSNRRAAWVTFFLWCVEMEYLPRGEKTAPERLEKPIVVRGIPSTYTPDELRILLANVRPAYLPWLVLAAFAGIRTEEICPQHGSSKSPLDWSDFQWDRGIIILRPETAKTGHRRVIPINDAIRAWLPEKASGRVGPHTHPSKPSTHKAKAETTRLGGFIGTWKRNALRHSFISFRAAQVGLAKTAMEAGNSENEARKSYNDAKGKDEADLWFAVMPPPGEKIPQKYPSPANIHAHAFRAPSENQGIARNAPG